MVKLSCVDPYNGNFLTYGLDVLYDRDEHNRPTATHVELIPLDADGVPAGPAAAIGSAWLHPGDMFDRKVGRKMAFQRAVEELTQHEAPILRHRMRSELWSDFLKQVRVR